MKYFHESTCCQLFGTDKGCANAFLMEKESDALLALELFDKYIGVIEALVADCTKSENSTKVKSFCVIISTTLNMT